MHAAVKKYLSEQKLEAVKNLSATRHETLIDKAEFKKRYIKLVKPVLTHAITDSYANSQEIYAGKTITVLTPLINRFVFQWLQNRIEWAADELGNVTETALRDLLMGAYAQGLSVDQIAQELTSSFVFSDSRAQMIARTETIAASVQGDIYGMKDAGVRSATYFAAEDERTCEACSDMDGEEFEIDDCEGVIPLHPSCRCNWLANVGD